MIITREALVETHACKEGLEFFDQHFPAGEGTQEEVFESIDKYAPTQDWQRWMARKLRLTATCRILYSDGQPGAEATYVDGKIHGLLRYWHPDGKPLAEETYAEGIRHGLRRVWWDDGQPCEDETWAHGVRISSL